MSEDRNRCAELIGSKDIARYQDEINDLYFKYLRRYPYPTSRGCILRERLVLINREINNPRNGKAI